MLTVGQLLEDDSLYSFLAPTWEPVWKRRLFHAGTNQQAPGCSTPIPEPAFWFNWTRSKVACLLSTPHSLPPRQPEGVWEAFHKCNVPPAQKDFIHKAL